MNLMSYDEKRIQLIYREKLKIQAEKKQHTRQAALLLMLSILFILLSSFNIFGFPFHEEPVVTITKISAD